MSQVAKHSSVVGGSTASRVLNCPGSVALVAQMPPKPSSEYADKGTLLHDVISDLLQSDNAVSSYLGRTYNGIELTQEMIDEKITPALEALNDIDPDMAMDVEVECNVGYGDLIPGAFGSVDLIGKLGRRTIVLDWKFGDGVVVDAENNKQLLFYAAAARRTASTQWAFEGTDEVELIIVQPPVVRRWVTTLDTLDRFESDLTRAVKLAQRPDAPVAAGEHCRWCAAKPICPVVNGEIDRIKDNAIKNLDAAQVGALLEKAELFESWIKDLRALAFDLLENDKPVPGYKLVAKRAVRQWVNEGETVDALTNLGLEPKEIFKAELISPAQAEKVLKKSKLALPPELVVAVSSGSTLAPESDPRPAVLNIGKQLSAALSKLH